MQTDKRKRIAFYLFYSGLVLLVASLPLSKFTMSVAQFLIAGGWLLDGDTGKKFKKFFNSKLGLLLASVYLVHIIGFLWTSDFAYAFKDIRIKLPLLILPLLLSTAPPVNRKQFEGILLALIGGVTVSSLISLSIFLGIIDRPVNDIRDISIFISHIRLSLLSCLSIVACCWLVIRHGNSPQSGYYLLLIPVAAWLILFIVLLESLTGLTILIVLSIIIVNWLVFKSGGAGIRVLTVCISIAVPLGCYYYVKSINESLVIEKPVDIASLETTTPSGNKYNHFPEQIAFENGHPLYLYICDVELEREWNNRSQLDFKGKDLRKQDLKYTLLRFLTSKGLRKDSAGVWALSETEVHSVERGITNVDYQKNANIRARIHQVLWEFHHYRRTGDPSGHSVAQRMEFWKAATGIIKNNLVAGVGTGDVPKAFQDQYVEMNTQLAKEWRLRAHNQYLTMAVAFGITGLVWFLVTLIYPLVVQVRKTDVLYVSFSIISIMSMFTEDTLETQAGVTFFALFTSLFLFINPDNTTTGGN
jgi:hypothetical protein